MTKRLKAAGYGPYSYPEGSAKGVAITDTSNNEEMIIKHDGITCSSFTASSVLSTTAGKKTQTTSLNNFITSTGGTVTISANGQNANLEVPTSYMTKSLSANCADGASVEYTDNVIFPDQGRVLCIAYVTNGLGAFQGSTHNSGEFFYSWNNESEGDGTITLLKGTGEFGVLGDYTGSETDLDDVDGTRVYLYSNLNKIKFTNESGGLVKWKFIIWDIT